MSSEELKATFHRTVYAAYNQGDVDKLDEIYVPEFVYHRFPFPDAVDLKAYKQTILDLRQAFTNVKLTFD
jgi:ketosteroid isomerase-like protein